MILVPTSQLKQTDDGDSAMACVCPCPDGQITRIDKVQCRAHYEQLLADLNNESFADVHA
jgi:hypothetical protein